MNKEDGMPRTTIEFNDAASSELDRLGQVLDIKKSDVLRNALSLYSLLVDEIKTKGGELLIVAPNEREKLIVVPGLQKRVDVEKAVAENTSKAAQLATAAKG